MSAGQTDIGEKVVVERPQLVDADAGLAHGLGPDDQSFDQLRDLPETTGQAVIRDRQGPDFDH
jgi:hypothetical protein